MLNSIFKGTTKDLSSGLPTQGDQIESEFLKDSGLSSAPVSQNRPDPNQLTNITTVGREGDIDVKNRRMLKEQRKYQYKAQMLAKAMTGALVGAGVIGKRQLVPGINNAEQRSVQERLSYGIAPMGVSSEQQNFGRRAVGLGSAMRDPAFFAQASAAVAPALASALSEDAKTLDRMYKNHLADAMDTTTGLYNPISSNFYQRYAQILKQRLRENSLYNAGQ